MTAPVRVPPLPPDRWPAGLLARATESVGGPFRAEGNVYGTVANGPLLLPAWLRLGGHILRRSTLPDRERELAILRTTAMAGAPYPFTQHTRIGAEVGLTEAEIDQVLVGDDERWPQTDRLIFEAVDRLMAVGSLGSRGFADLAAHYEPPQLLDLLATVAFYRMAAWTLNSCGTPLDDGQVNRLRPISGPTPAPAPDNDLSQRMAPVGLDEWPEHLLAETASWPRFAGRPGLRAAGVYGTLANHPPLFIAAGPLMAHLLVDNSLTDIDRELVIIRSTLRDRGRYPYRQHVAIGQRAGLRPDELQALAEPEPALDDPARHSLAAVVDELHDGNTVSQPCWDAACRHFSVTQLLDAVATAGFYGLISFILNSAGTALEPGAVELPEAIKRKDLR